MRHCDNSLARVVARHPEGVPHKVIARALGLTEEEVAQILQKALGKMKEHMT
jgi:DNA-directed RNA polymerase specialized sigma subunit